MSQISSNHLNEEILADLTDRLKKFSEKWGASIRQQRLLMMMSTLRASAIFQISSHVNEALTAHRAGKSLAPFQTKFEELQSTEFLLQLGIKGRTLEVGRFQGETRQDALQLLKDFSVFVGQKAAAYFSELPPYQPVINVDTPSTELVVAPVVAPVAIEDRKKATDITEITEITEKPPSQLERIHLSSLVKLQRMTEADVDRIFFAIRRADNPLFLKAYCKQSILPLYMALSWDIRQRKARGETISERDMQLKQQLENAYGVCVEKRNKLLGIKDAQIVTPSLVSATPRVLKLTAQPVVTEKRDLVPSQKPDVAPEGRGEMVKGIGRWVTGRAVALGMIGASAVSILALSVSGFFGGSAVAQKTTSLQSPEASSYSVATQFNSVAETTPQQNIVPEPVIIDEVASPEPQISAVAKPVHKIHKPHKIRKIFVKSSNDNYLMKEEKPAKIGDFQMAVTKQDTLDRLCRVYTQPTFLCGNA